MSKYEKVITHDVRIIHYPTLGNGDMPIRLYKHNEKEYIHLTAITNSIGFNSYNALQKVTTFIKLNKKLAVCVCVLAKAPTRRMDRLITFINSTENSTPPLSVVPDKEYVQVTTQVVPDGIIDSTNDLIDMVKEIRTSHSAQRRKLEALEKECNRLQQVILDVEESKKYLSLPYDTNYGFYDTWGVTAYIKQKYSKKGGDSSPHSKFVKALGELCQRISEECGIVAYKDLVPDHVRKIHVYTNDMRGVYRQDVQEEAFLQMLGLPKKPYVFVNDQLRTQFPSVAPNASLKLI